MRGAPHRPAYEFAVPSPTALTAPRRILLVRLSAMGDLVIATALFEGLRQAWPEAEIDWLVQSEFAGLLRSQPAIHEVHVWERRAWSELLRRGRWLSLVRTILEFRRRLHARRYDWVLDAQGLAKSRALAWLAGGRQRIGYTSKEPLTSLLHQTVVRQKEAAPGRERIGGEHAPMLRRLTGTEIGAPRLSRPEGQPPRPPNLVLAPFTTRPQKHWPEAYWRQLIEQLAARGEALSLLGGPGDRAAAARILDGLPAGTVNNLVGATSLSEALAWIADARALIGVDTGLTHMGIAYDRPTVAIFGSTLPYRTGGRAPLRVLWKGLPCSPCARKPTCGGRFDCLTGIHPTEVLKALDEVLA